MTELEDFIVQEPYSPTEEEKRAIAELEAKGLEAEDWSSPQKGIVSFKENMRKHMYYEQNCRCAYCRIELPIACCFLQREHIVPKTSHPKLMFEPRNLCFACDRCNNYKKDEEVLTNPEANDYPSNTEDFKIVNPFIHKYSEHIELKEGIIYQGKTDEGRFTVNTCQLFRPDLALERAKQRMKDEDPLTIQSQLLSLLSSLPVSEDEINGVKKNFEKIVKMYKKSQ